MLWLTMSPTERDRQTIRLPRALPPFTLLVRPLRLLREHGLGLRQSAKGKVRRGMYSGSDRAFEAGRILTPEGLFLPVQSYPRPPAAAGPLPLATLFDERAARRQLEPAKNCLPACATAVFFPAFSVA